MGMKIVENVLKRHSDDRKKLKVLKKKREELETVLNARRGDIRDVKQIDDKVRELDWQIKLECAAMMRRIFDDILDEDETSIASSSNSEGPEHENLSSKLNQMQTVIGQGGIGRTTIRNLNSNFKSIFNNVQFIENNYHQSPGSERKE